jgi:hypothetical protein
MDDLTLPVTASIRRLAEGFLGFDPWEAAPRRSGWFDNGYDHLPLHIPAGLAIARLRVVEVAPTYFFSPFLTPTPSDIADALRLRDPELREAPNAPR